MTSRGLGKLPLIGSVGLIAAGSVVYGASRVGGDAWYDPIPLTASIRPEARTGLTAALGVAHPEDVTLYDLKLAYDPGAATFTLGEEVWFTNNTAAPLADLVFRIYANASPPSSGPEVRFGSGSCLGDVRCTVSTVNASAVRVVPATPIPPGGRLHITLALDGTLTRIDASRTSVLAQGLEGMEALLGGGAEGGDYGILAVGDGIVSFGNFYAVLARRTSRGWETSESSKLGDLGSDAMANFRATVDLPAHAKVAVTGVVAGEEPVPGKPDRRRVRIVAAAIRDFALLFGDDMEMSTRDIRGVHVRSYCLTRDRAAGAKVLDVAAHALETYERRFGAYPYTDLSVSEEAIVGGAGGVEFSGLVTAASMFYRPAGGVGPAASGGGAEAGGLAGMLAQLGGGGLFASMTDGMLEFVVAHEVAHQWWHGLIGSDSRDHPFVDEALAQYSAIIYLEDRYGRVRADKDGTQNVKMNYETMRMLGKDDQPADHPVASFSSSPQYAGVIYGKAPYFYKAVREAVGDAAFFDAMRSYVTRYRFKEAPARGLPDMLAQRGGEAKVRPLEHHWLDEMHGDEDLGKGDLASMMGGLGGLGGAAGLEGLGDMTEVLKMLEGVGFGGAAGAGAGAGGITPPSSGDPDVDQLLKGLLGQ
jgi:hypothetical protein